MISDVTSSLLLDRLVSTYILQCKVLSHWPLDFPSGGRSRCRHEGLEIVWTSKTWVKILGIFELWCISTPIRRIGLCPLICCRAAAAQSQLLAASTVKNNTVIKKGIYYNLIMMMYIEQYNLHNLDGVQTQHKDFMLTSTSSSNTLSMYSR